MSPSRARAALIIAAIAIGSALAGAGIDRWVMMRGPRHGHQGGPLSANPSPEGMARRRAEMLGRMTKELNLTPAQRAGIDSIMQRTDSALRIVRREMQPRLTQIFEGSRAEISARLDSAQRVKFAKSQRGRR
jgi:Spy/CpxP family protein refolding chaperone